MVSISKKIINFGIAVIRHALDGQKNVSEETYLHRIKICEECPLNHSGECGLCGCPIEKKALWASEECPDKKWPSLSESSEPKKTSTSGLTANARQKQNKKNCSACKKRS